MRLDPTYLTYITKEEMRVLLAVEMGMRNHEYVPVHLIEKISHLGRSCSYTYLKLLLKNKLVYHQRKKYDGYKLTYLGYDYLALNVFMKRGVVKTIVGKIGVGKESDVYKCLNEEGQEVILKFARLGRVSFKTVKNNRDYIKNRTQYSWLYLSRLQAIKEFAFMELLHKNEFPTPTPISQNRHGVVMSLVDGVPFTQVRGIEDPAKVHNELIDLITKLAEHGLIHSDFNEFNLMIHPDTYKITMIDFPQMVSTSHKNAEYYYKRDIDCIHRYFEKKMKFVSQYETPFEEVEKIKDLDNEVRASGHIKKELNNNLNDLDILNEIQLASGSDDEDEDLYDGELRSDEEEDDEQDDEEAEEEKEEIFNQQPKRHNKKSSDDILNELDIKQDQKQNINDLDDGFDLNEEGIDNNKNLEENSQEQDDDDEEDEEYDEEAEEKRRQEKKMLKKQKKEQKNKKSSGKNDKLREQLLEKIRIQEEIDEQKKKQKELKKQQKKLKKQQQKEEEEKQQQQQNEEEQKQEDEEENNDDDSENEYEEGEYDENDEEYLENQRKLMENEDLKQKVEKHLTNQINKKFKKKFKIIKYTKSNMGKDVKNNREYNADFF